MNDLTTQRQQFDSCLDKVCDTFMSVVLIVSCIFLQFATQVSQSLMEQKVSKQIDHYTNRWLIDG